LNPGVRISLMIEGQEGVEWEQWLALALAAEAAGLEGLFRSDHYRSIERGEPEGSLDAWATLAALAARTERLRLGTMVSPVTFRPASVLAKSVVTVDHISGGRAELGIGAGWYEAEHDAHGFPFPPLGERFAKLEADAEAIVHAWTDDDRQQPKPVQRPHPPLIVGGSAKPRGARLAARFAQEYNTIFVPAETCRERRAALDEACHVVGRDPSTLPLSLMTGCVIGRDEAELRERAAALQRIRGDEGDIGAWIARNTERGMLIGTVEQLVDRLRVLEEAGVTRVFLQHLDHRDLAAVEVMGRDLAPAVA
jgi:alkanesulfonate monooxygenase SsuD/methylene tetrahydromethanopterin reductase-like flavin-dependent oxidoreductase (luciferase family)